MLYKNTKFFIRARYIILWWNKHKQGFIIAVRHTTNDKNDITSRPVDAA